MVKYNFKLKFQFIKILSFLKSDEWKSLLNSIFDTLPAISK